ncbi:uncharacterized protein EV422DRAFT_512868 [Fimicolochytrium jonesii]|uniref:uncharacterized protein n=1 Tax=Fimicolochytrium jonesii TaxID=1396493 RepID=UPI0022FE4ACB|nr:uncharacterized protein EV422DRAFT_512868 [Fimicolochytrium jonesii]KAI8827164.1 hypothetical protein EV422DRAFT_512868 [Fimicolochytrium jonesii]
MAIFFWRKQQLDDEQILASLDRQIRRTEVRVSSIRQRHQRIKHAWLYYSVSIYVFVLVLYFTYLKPRRDPWDIWLVKTGVVVVGAPGIYFGNRFIRYWYQRKEKAERDLLESLKAKQKEKVDALKENEAYRKTQLLLQRYDTPTKDRPAGDELVDAKGHSRPTTPLPFPPSHIKMGQPSKQMGPPSLAPPGTPGMAPVPGKQIDNPTQTTRSPSPSPAFLSIPPFDPTQLPNRSDSPLPPPPTPTPQHPYAKTWFDKVIDVMIGETNDTNSPASKYALICEECFTHNGLVPAEAYSDARTYEISFFSFVPFPFLPPGGVVRFLSFRLGVCWGDVRPTMTFVELNLCFHRRLPLHALRPPHHPQTLRQHDLPIKPLPVPVHPQRPQHRQSAAYTPSTRGGRRPRCVCGQCEREWRDDVYESETVAEPARVLCAQA